MNARPLAATLLLVAAACGDISTVSSDAASQDASGDAAPEVGTVSLELHDPFGEGGPALPGSTMLVLMPDGTVIGDDVTDDDGLASVDDVPQGAIMLVFVEVMAGTEGNLTIAVYDVGPGDEISFGRDDVEGELLGTMQILLPAYKDPAPTYHVSNGCSHNSNTVTTVGLSFYEGCVIDGDADVLAWVVGESGAILGYLDANRPFSADMPMDLSALSWENPDTLDVTLTDIPSEVRTVSFQASQLLETREYGNPLFELDNLDTPDPEMELAVKVPGGFGDSTLVQLAFEPNQTSLGGQVVMHRADDDVEWALSEQLLPWYSAGVYSAPERTISWSRTAGRAPDAHYIIFSWLEQDSGTENAWYTVSPPDWTELALPPLPEEWEEYAPVEPAASVVQIYAAESSVVDGYGAAHEVGFDLVGEDLVHPLPPGSTVQLSLGAGASF